MAKHGTRTMYVHYGCRCDECCKAEHKQYLKRKRTQTRKRTNSKWGNLEGVEPYSSKARRRETQKEYNLRRYHMIKGRPSEHSHPITWQEIAEKYDMRCAICGCEVNPEDMWIGKDGRKRFGRKYPTVDHIIALKNGGADTMGNVQLTCKHCNSAKGAKRQANAG